MSVSRLLLARAVADRAAICLTLALVAALLTAPVPILGFLLGRGRPGGSNVQLFVLLGIGPYAAMVAAALALFSIYYGLVRRYLVQQTEPRVVAGILVSLSVLAYVSYGFIHALWE